MSPSSLQEIKVRARTFISAGGVLHGIFPVAAEFCANVDRPDRQDRHTEAIIDTMQMQHWLYYLDLLPHTVSKPYAYAYALIAEYAAGDTYAGWHTKAILQRREGLTTTELALRLLQSVCTNMTPAIENAMR